MSYCKYTPYPNLVGTVPVDVPVQPLTVFDFKSSDNPFLYSYPK
jgi:hypothetical protein